MTKVDTDERPRGRWWRTILGLSWAALGALALYAIPARADEDPDRPRAHRAKPAATAPARSAAALGRPDRISLVFSNVDVRDALVRIAQYAGVDVLLAPGATGSISINLRQRTPEEAVRMVAASAGLYVTKAQNAFIVGSAAEVQRAVSEFGLTEVVQLQNAKPADAVAYLSKAAPLVKAEALATGVSITGPLEELQKAREALGMFDVPAPQEPDKQDTLLLVIQKADPEQVETVVRQAYPNVTVSRQERVLVVNGPSSVLRAVEAATKVVDVAAPTAPEENEVAVYRFQYLHAKQAEEALKLVFPDLKLAASPEPNMPPMATFNPLTTGAFNTGGTGTSGSNGGGGGGYGQTGTSGTTGTGGSTAPSFTRSTSLILVGKSSEVQAALKALKEMDVPQPFVRIDAALVEVTDEGLKDLGVEWSWQDGHFTFAQTQGIQANLDTSNVKTSDFTAAVKALVTQKKANLLANPNISCVDNEDASIFIGELRRFRGSTVVSPGVGTVQGTETVPVGVALLVRPRIHPDGNITLKVHPVVSTVLSTVDGLPQTASREADTTVNLREGEELIIGGLFRTEDTKTADKVPLLGDLPILGALFRSSTNTKNKSEIVVIIRVYPVFPNPAPERDFTKGVAP